MLAIGAINLYMLSALVWWAFALVRFQERNYESQIEKLDLKKQLVEVKIENYLLAHQNFNLSRMSDSQTGDFQWRCLQNQSNRRNLRFSKN